jgi:hypothetical protein
MFTASLPNEFGDYGEQIYLAGWNRAQGETKGEVKSKK